MYDIVVIGGGISGLYVASEINKTKKLALFEKSQYYGGRVYTDSFTVNSTKYNLEAGAGRILSGHKKMLGLIHQHGLDDKLLKIGSNIDFVPSKRYTMKDSFIDKTGFHFIDKVIKISENDSDDDLRKITFREYAASHLTKDEVKFMTDSIGYYGDLVVQNAYDAIKVFKTSIRSDKKYYVMTDGFGQLIDRMAAYVKSKHTCHLNKCCRDIFYNDGIFTLNMDNKRVLSKNVVLAIPKQNLMDIDYLKPYFPLLKTIESIRLVRIYSIYHPDDVLFNNIGKTTTNNHLNYIIPINPETGVIMTSYSDHTKADFWSKIKDDRRRLNDTLNKNIENVFRINVKSPKVIKVYDWEHGVGVWKKNVDSKKNIQLISQPERNTPLFIVGENYSKYQGWMEGAIESVDKIIPKLIR